MIKEVLMPIGLPGCGKTTYLRNYAAYKPITFISLDQIRQELTGNMSDLSRDKDVRSLAEDRFTQALDSDAEGTGTILLDSTNLSPRGRSKYMSILKAAKEKGREILLKVFEFTLTAKESAERQKGRARQIPEKDIYYLAQFKKPFLASEAEGVPSKVFAVNPGEPLPNAEMLVALKGVKNYTQFDAFAQAQGFWREGEEWCSARAAKLAVPRKLLSTKDTKLKAALQQFIQKGFALSVSENEKPAKKSGLKFA